MYAEVNLECFPLITVFLVLHEVGSLTGNFPKETRIAGQWVQRFSCCSLLRAGIASTSLSFSHGFGVLKSGPRTCKVSILLSQASPQSHLS